MENNSTFNNMEQNDSTLMASAPTYDSRREKYEEENSQLRSENHECKTEILTKNIELEQSESNLEIANVKISELEEEIKKLKSSDEKFEKIQKEQNEENQKKIDSALDSLYLKMKDEFPKLIETTVNDSTDFYIISNKAVKISFSVITVCISVFMVLVTLSGIFALLKFIVQIFTTG